MYLLFPQPDSEREATASLTERWMLPDEHLVAMGIAMYPQFAAGQQYPRINCDLPATAKKSLAGNASWPQ